MKQDGQNWMWWIWTNDGRCAAGPRDAKAPPSQLPALLNEDGQKNNGARLFVDGRGTSTQADPQVSS